MICLRFSFCRCIRGQPAHIAIPAEIDEHGAPPDTNGHRVRSTPASSQNRSATGTSSTNEAEMGDLRAMEVRWNNNDSWYSVSVSSRCHSPWVGPVRRTRASKLKSGLGAYLASELLLGHRSQLNVEIGLVHQQSYEIKF